MGLWGWAGFLSPRRWNVSRFDGPRDQQTDLFSGNCLVGPLLDALLQLRLSLHLWRGSVAAMNADGKVIRWQAGAEGERDWKSRRLSSVAMRHG